MKIGELIDRVARDGVEARFVRYLIAEGVIPPPSGGRATAEYGEEHLRGVIAYLNLRDLGVSMPQVKALMRAEAGMTIPVRIAGGVWLHIDMSELDKSLSPTDAAESACRALEQILSISNTKGTDDHADATA